MKLTWKTWIPITMAILGIFYALDARVNAQAQGPNPTGPVVILPMHSDTSPALRTMESLPQLNREILEIPLHPKSPEINPNANSIDPVVQRALPEGAGMPGTDQNFEGVNNINGVLPPDTNGDVGPNHYIQMVNLSFAIWDKQGNLLYGPVNGNTLWQGFGGPCETNNDGDPVALYDETADRWVLTQFAINNGIECVAISTSPDPLGSYHRYALNVGGIPDYPKLSVWGDAYYATYRNFGSGFDMQAAAHNRAKMLVGDPTAETVIFSISSALPTENVDGFIPVDLDGFAPPAGANGLFLGKISDEAGSSQDALVMFEMDVDWTTPANSTFSAPLYMATAAFNDLLCGDLYGACAPQPDTGQTLHMLSFALMHRAAYRNFGSYQAIVANHTVNVGSNQAGVRWYELRNSGSGWDIYQQGTFAPDANHRWMGGIAMDSSGNIALGYSVSSSSVYPSIRYAGRLASDPLGVMGQGEAEIIAGSGSQTHSAARWGDYAMMAVDPFDDCTFWFTTEYIQTTGSAPWRTRVASFKFPTCGGPSGTLTGQVYDSGTMTGIDGAQVVAAGALITQTGGTTADANGVYTITLPVGTYTVTASAFGYVDGTVTGVGVLSGTVTTQDFGLDSATSVVVEGVITDDTMNWPLYAQINIGGGYNGGPIWTDPVSGYYSVTLPVGVYPFEVSAFVEGYTPQTTVVTVTTTLAPEGGAATYCSTPNIPFPDDPDITDSLVLPDSGVITDLNLQITAAHTWVGDTTFTLTHNDTATSVVAIDRPGWTNTGFGCSSNDINVNLDDEGVDGPVESQCAVTPPALFGNPTPNNPLSAFDTQNVAGTWTITASDAAGGDTGTLNSWCISAVVDPPAPIQTANFSLVADLSVCTAPGYTFSGLLETFETGALPAGWSNIDNIASGGVWLFNDPGGRGNLTGGTGLFAIIDSDFYGSSAFQDTELRTPVLDLSSQSNVILEFDTNLNIYDFGLVESADVDVSDDGGSTWTNVWHQDQNGGDFTGHVVLDITAIAANEPDVVIRFHYYDANYEWWWQVDNVTMGTCNPPASGGLVVGNVYDVNTLAPVNDAWVWNETGSLSYAVATPLDPAVDDAFYTVYSLGGSQVHTSTYTLYGEDVQAVNVVDFDTVGQDFYLPSGFIVTDPDAFDLTLELGTNATYPLTMTETGGASVEFSIAEIPGISPVAGPGSVLLPVVTPNYPTDIQRTAKQLDGAFSFSTSQSASAPVVSIPKAPSTPAGGYTLTHSLTQNIVQFNSVACNAGGLHTDNSYLRRFTLDDFGINTGFDVVSVDIGIETATGATGTQPVEVRLYTWDPSTSFTYANFTLIGQTATDLADLSLAVANIPVEGTVPAGGTLVVEFFTPNGQTAGNGLFVGSNADGQTDFTFLAAADCGVTEPTDTGTLGFPGMHWVLNVNGTAGGDVPWVIESPITGTVPANGDATVNVTFDASQVPVPGLYTAFLNIGLDAPQESVVIPLTLTVTCATCGTLEGSITDAATTLPLVSTIHITNTGGVDVMLEDVTSYSLDLLPGDYYVTASADGYLTESAIATVTNGGTTTQDFALWADTSLLSFSPASVEEFMNIGDVVTNTITITNSGATAMDYEVNIGGYSGPFVLVSKTEVHIPRFTGEVDKIDRPLSDGPAPEVTKAQIQGPIFETPMGEQAYGLDVFPGLNLVQFPDVDVPGAMNPIGSVPQFHPAGDFLNGDFSTLYALDYDTNEFVAIDTATGARTVIGTTAPNGNWSGMSGATDGTLYAASSNCGVSSTLYTVDPSDGTLTTVGEIGSGTCIIDIAINADGEMFGVDIVSDNLYAIDPSTGAGTIVGSLGVDANFAQGMDFEENSGILYWSAYTAQGELRIIDTATGASASVGAFAGGAEIDAFAFTTGGSGGVGGWAYAVPNFGTIPPFSVTTFDLVFDATSLFQTGDYFAELSFDGNFVNDPGTMPLTMHVSCPTCGFLAGDIYDAFTTSPVDADVFVSSSNGTAITLTGVASYSLALQPGTYDFLVTANDYFSATASVELAAGQTVVTDFPLTPMVAVLESTPAGFETTLVLGQVFTDTLVLNNSGTISFDYSLSDVQTGSPLDTRTPMAGSILLVDDDDNGPDVQAYYTTVLDAMGLSYDIWDTGGSDNEPDEATLAGYDTVIWFTGVSFGGTAGPGSAGETALSTWLDSGACFFISSQDYVFDRGVTTFMTNYLGLASATSDVGQTTVTGQGSLFTGLGPYGLSYPFSNWSDEFTPDGTAEVAFSGDFGNAAVNKLTSSYATAFLGYPLEAIASVTDQVDVMSAFLDSCATEAPWLIELPATGSVAAGDSATVEIVFDTSVITQTGTYTAEIRIDGTFDNTASPAVVVMHVVEEGIGGVDLGDSTGVGEPDTVVTHTMWITNTGDYADVFTLAVAGNTWVTDISATTIALDPGEVAYVMCFVSIPADAADGDEDTVSVTVTGSFDADVTDTGTATTTADVPEPATYEIYLPILKKQ